MLFTTPSILITDDDHAFRETVRGVLEPRGFRTLTAANGEEALRIVGAEPVHLLLLDMHMPRLTGLDTVRRIRELDLRLPCVLLSAALDDGIVNAARSANIFTVLSKPIRRCEITSAVDQIFRHVYGWPQSDH